MINRENKYVIENYGKKTVFSNFLPGISGKMGIPLWCFYVNRGQAISSFGVADKDHSIMQFYPAHQAYQNTKRFGFRTFLKIENEVFEAFTEESNQHEMLIGMNDLEIRETNHEMGFTVKIKYITLPGEAVAGLVRKVTFENIGTKSREIEFIDGMSAILPYGVNLKSMNEMGQTTKAWMQVEESESKCPIFKLRVSMEDSAQVQEIKSGNYGFALDQNGQELDVIVNNEAVFGYDTSLEDPKELREYSLEQILKNPQITKNDLPSCYFAKKIQIGEKESYTFYEVYGQTDHTEYLTILRRKMKEEGYFENKFEEADYLTMEITNKIDTKTNHKLFDLYCRQTYLDNVLRGGEPVILGKDKIFYLYSRKHGDIERDYNYFRLLPEFYSQGNGNFRDVNQNRRCDVRFSPFVKKENIALFYNAIQIDGYNPLGIEKMTYYLEEDKAQKYGELEGFLKESFTPGSLMKQLMESGQTNDFSEIMSDATAVGKTDFIEGYWSDHWTYNLDLVEEYLAIYPEEKETLLFKDRTYTYLVGKEWILPSRKRYVETEHGIRQYHFLEKNKQYQVDQKVMNQKGEIVTNTLIEKMTLLCLLKFAALDPYTMGVEMEGGKPGWYDALNGLPGLLGSSMAETYELDRLLFFVIDAMQTNHQLIILSREMDRLLTALLQSVEFYLKEDKPGSISFYHQRGVALEQYREAIKEKLSAETIQYSSKEVAEKLFVLKTVVTSGIQRAMDKKNETGNGICPTYFYYSVVEYQKTAEGIVLLEVKQEEVPDFLEGSVRYLKTDLQKKEKQELYQKIHKSNLYDQRLKMYKVNADLEHASYEIGRAKAFTPGWLENESIWLHMEYKYLLELLKSDLEEEFLSEFPNLLIPFLKEETYGRSLLENSSFIASSVNPNEKIWGKGFVARLSGSTAEFIHMWQIMMFGKQPFQYQDEKLLLQFSPMIPDFLIGESKEIEVTFLGNIKVRYQLPDRNNITPTSVKVESYQLVSKDQEVKLVQEEVLSESDAQRIRDGEVIEIIVKIRRKK